MNKLGSIYTYKDFTSTVNVRSKIRNQIRNGVIAARSINHQIGKSSNWIRMIYYHHVFNDEKKDFERQLLFLKNFGEFISIDQVYDLVKGDEKIDGRYFCITFDDGFQNTYTNMMNITSNLNIPVIIYLPTAFIEADTNDPEVVDLLRIFAPKNSKIVPFLSWDECKEMKNHQITFGSHTVTHPILSKLKYAEVEYQLAQSKKIIEEKLGSPCIHFACPKGVADRDFDPVITAEIAKKTGYKTLVSVKRGTINRGHDVYSLNREHLIAKWGNHQIKYFFGH